MPRDTTTQKSAHKAKDTGSSAVLIVLQWLAYAMWTATLVFLSWLLSATLTYYFISKSDSYEHLVYILAGLVVLLPIGTVLDIAYAKREPVHKQGFAAVVLVLNAVVVFLAALAAVITAVVSAFTLVLHPESSTGATIAIVSAGIVAVLALLLFVRILSNPKTRFFTKLFPWLVVAVSLVGVGMAIAGPLRVEYESREDRVLEKGLPELAMEIRNYASSNQQLPDNLDDLAVSSRASEARSLIKDNKVDYRIIQQPQASSSKTKSPVNPPAIEGRFELCVDYQAKRGSGKTTATGSYPSYLFIDNHPAGHVCYNQSTY